MSRCESKPESASLHKVGAAKLPELEKPAIGGEEAEEAAVEPSGVEGDSARGKGSRGAWETWLGGWESRDSRRAKFSGEPDAGNLLVRFD